MSPDQMRHAGDGIERGTDLVRHVGQKIALGNTGGFGGFLGNSEFGSTFDNQLLEPMPMLLELLLIQNALRDIATNAKNPDDLSLFVKQGPFIGLNVAGLAILVVIWLHLVDQRPALREDGIFLCLIEACSIRRKNLPVVFADHASWHGR
jgi:hypothetical protein